jgi:hypothetical protein
LDLTTSGGVASAFIATAFAQEGAEVS